MWREEFPHVQCWGVYSGTQFSICVLYSRERPCSRHAFPRVFAQQWFIIGRAVFILSPILWFEFRLTQVGKHNINTAEAARRNPVITIPGNIENNYWFGLLSLNITKITKHYVDGVWKILHILISLVKQKKIAHWGICKQAASQIMSTALHKHRGMCSCSTKCVHSGWMLYQLLSKWNVRRYHILWLLLSFCFMKALARHSDNHMNWTISHSLLPFQAQPQREQ